MRDRIDQSTASQRHTTASRPFFNPQENGSFLLQSRMAAEFLQLPTCPETNGIRRSSQRASAQRPRRVAQHGELPRSVPKDRRVAVAVFLRPESRK